MNLLEQFIQYTQQTLKLNIAQTPLLLAVSGGIDSVVMVDLCQKAGFPFVIAHCNFQLRGDESVRDEKFVTALAARYEKQVFVQHFDTEAYATAHKLSIQVAARNLRYTWFEELLNTHRIETNGTIAPTQKIAYLATAHHADDNIETLLLNFFRGTGMSGLHGIAAKQGHTIRPLLFAKRTDLVTYATANNLSWVEDSSNQSDKYSRNFVRHQIVPLLKTIFPQVDDNLLGNIERFKEIEQVYNATISQQKAKLLEKKGNEWHIPLLKLKKQAPLKTIVYEIVKDFGFAATQTSEVIKLLDAANGSYMASPSHRLIINRNWLIIAPLPTEEATNILIEKTDKTIHFKEGTLTLDWQNLNSNISNNGESFATDANIATLNAADITLPLLLRPWKQGDYFYPLGMEKKKKISKFLIDQKCSKTEKEKVWVIESNKRILWVIGYRIDNRFRKTATCKEQLVITFNKEINKG